MDKRKITKIYKTIQHLKNNTQH